MPAAYASSEKRIELVAAAAELLYTQGLQRTTLAHVAEKANVPVGNVYYYFKTKEALAEAVIETHVERRRVLFESWGETKRTPYERLRAFVQTPLAHPESVVQFGCPYGSLCQELEKLAPDAPLARAASRLMEQEVEWNASQFRELGFSKKAAEALAVDLVSQRQGAMLVAQALRSEEVLRRQVKRLEQWLEVQVESEPGKKRS